jgi:hypothetical protein
MENITKKSLPEKIPFSWPLKKVTIEYRYNNKRQAIRS